MLGMMNCSTDAVDFYASPSSARQIAVGDIRVFSQTKTKPSITYTNDGKKLVNGKLDTSQIEPQKSWNQLIINNVVDKQLKQIEPEVQRKSSVKKTVSSLRKFLPFTKTETTKKSKSKCPKKNCTTIKVVVE